MALADFQQMVDDMVRDQGRIVTPAVRDRAIEQARLRYSADRLRTLAVDLVWPATGVFGPVPEGWDASCHVSAATVDARPVHIAAYQAVDGWGLESEPALLAGMVVHLTYTTAHVLTVDQDTIPVAHRLAVASHAAYQLCTQLATHYSGQRETMVNADHSATESRARDFAARAKEYRTAYFVGTGQVDPFAQAAAGGGTTSAASAVVSWPGRPRNRLTRGLQ